MVDHGLKIYDDTKVAIFGLDDLATRYIYGREIGVDETASVILPELQGHKSCQYIIPDHHDYGDADFMSTPSVIIREGTKIKWEAPNVPSGYKCSGYLIVCIYT